MAKTREIPEYIRRKVIKAREAGLSYRKIGSQLKIGAETGREIYQKFQEINSVKNRPRSGRPRKTTARVDQFIIRIVSNDQFLNAKKIKERVKTRSGVDISETTVRLRLHKNGIYDHVTNKTKVDGKVRSKGWFLKNGN
ncbi:hypothetical protein DSO57_1039694 [Entomophthora muscae]|uniref:Uncharacterized protein n=1 Tax=Entomophthora muscae TaxID=34485 RepID=A0ACC2SW38_9FUNG|nr:hypothetical protein DSO57_1039694 [Entomophthora muscae]